MAQLFSHETQELFDRADLAIEESIRLRADHRKVMERARQIHERIEMGLGRLFAIDRHKE